MSRDLDFEPPRKMQKMNGKSFNIFLYTYKTFRIFFLKFLYGNLLGFFSIPCKCQKNIDTYILLTLKIHI